MQSSESPHKDAEDGGDDKKSSLSASPQMIAFRMLAGRLVQVRASEVDQLKADKLAEADAAKTDLPMPEQSQTHIGT